MLFHRVSPFKTAIPCLLSLLTFSGSMMAKEFVIKLKSQSHDFSSALISFQNETKLKVEDQHAKGSLVLVDIAEAKNAVNSNETLAKKVLEIRENPSVEYIVPNISFHTMQQPDDPQFSSQWSLEKVNASQAWDYHVGSKDVTIAVIDTGVDVNHEDLAANIWVNKEEIPGNGLDDDGNGYIDDVNGWDFRDNDNDPGDETSSKNPGHGTHCAGIVGAVGNNGLGVSGAAQQTSIMAIRFIGSDGSGDLMSAAKSIDYAVDNNANVISASWGAAVQRSGAKPILEAIQRAEAKGIIFVAAAANDGKSNDTREVYPANAGFSNVISVAASDPQDQKPSWSNFGKYNVDLSSPGLDILSTVPGNQYRKLSGTSMATPLVAGSLGTLLSHAQEIGYEVGHEEAKALLQATGADVQIETACQCRIDLEAAMKNMLNDALYLVPNALTIAPQETKEFKAVGGKGPYSFSTADEKIATINQEGVLTAVAEGQTEVLVKDATGETAATNTIYVGRSTPEDGGGSSCPFGPLCEPMCKINPQLPWCNAGLEL